VTAAAALSLLTLCFQAAFAQNAPGPSAVPQPSLKPPATIRADQPIQLVVNARLNSVRKGDFVVYMTRDGDFLLLQQDLVNMGVPRPVGRNMEVAGETVVSLRSIVGADFSFNEKTLTLEIQLPASMLEDQNLNLGATLPTVPIQPRTPGGFLNYRLGYAHSQSGFEAFNGATELGINIGKFLFLDNHTFTTAESQYRSVRLQTQLLYDEPEQLRRWTLGDTFASSGDLGSTVNLGGISVTKLYQINPYFIKTPLASFAGAVTAPSTVDVYMNGARVQSQTVAPGNFSLQNLNAYNATGLRNVEVVIRDAFGREQYVAFPYFFSEQLLAKGLDEYSYNAGFIRNNFGVTSNDYGTAALSGFYRYGLSDTLTLGFGGDATRDHINLGPRASFNTVKAGVITAALSVSHDRDVTSRSGLAGTVNHTYIAGPFSSQLFVRRLTEDYSVLGIDAVDKPKLQGSASVSYGNRLAGTFSLSYAIQTAFSGVNDQHSTTVGYSRTLFRNVSLVANVSRVNADTSGYAAFVGLSIFGANGHTASASHFKGKDGDIADQLQYAKTPPIGEGLGYRVFTQRAVSAGAVSETISPFVQYNARNAILTAEGTSFVNGGGGGADFYQLAVTGAAVYIGNDFYLSRPVNDSFGVVNIEPPLAGVRVLKSNAEVGVTDANGAVFIPNLGSYQVNEVAIQPKDIPLDYELSHSAQKMRPPFRAGSVARFDLRRIRAVSGTLKLRSDGVLTPLENYKFVLDGTAGTAQISTIRDGNFYIENIIPGRYSAELNVDDKRCRVEALIPDTNEIVTDLGDLICERIP